MLKARQIQFKMILFFCLLIGFLISVFYLFHRNFNVVHEELYQKSKDQIFVMDSLTMIESELSFYSDQMNLYLTTGQKDVFVSLQDTQSKIEKTLEVLASFNTQHFSGLVGMRHSTSLNPVEELEDLLPKFFSQTISPDNFYQFFYLVHDNIDLYFNNARLFIESDLFVHSQSLPVSYSIQPPSALSVGMDQLMKAYNKIFWNLTQSKQFEYTQDAKYYQMALIALSLALLLFGSFVLRDVLVYIQEAQLRDKKMTAMEGKDSITGLFNKNSFDVVALQELQRAKRKGYAFGIMLIRVEPFEQIKKNFGQLAFYRLMYQVADSLKKICRFYDGVYKYKENYFSLILTETDKDGIQNFTDRLQKEIFGKSFFVKNDQTQVIPKISVASANYPSDGETVFALLQMAEKNFSDVVEPLPVSAIEKIAPCGVDLPEIQLRVILPLTMDYIRMCFELREILHHGAEILLEEQPQFQDDQTLSFEMISEIEELPQEMEIPQEVELVSSQQQEDGTLVSFDDIIDKYSKSPAKGAKIVENVRPKAVNEKPIIQRTVVDLDSMPDVVLALTQDETTLQDMARKSKESKQKAAETIQREVIKPDHKSQFLAEELVKKITSKYQHVNELNTNGSISHIEVVKEEDDDEVIMVNFEREKNDLAEKFRQRLRSRRGPSS